MFWPEALCQLALCHKRAPRLVLTDVNAGFLDTSEKCFRAGLVMGKRLMSK